MTNFVTRLIGAQLAKGEPRSAPGFATLGAASARAGGHLCLGPVADLEQLWQRQGDIGMEVRR